MSWYDPTTQRWRDDPSGNSVFSLAKSIWEMQRKSGLPPTPDITDTAVIMAQLEKKRQLAALRGRASTFLTGPRGVGPGLPTSEIAQSFLQSAIEQRYADLETQPTKLTPATGRPTRPAPSREQIPWQEQGAG